MSISQRPLIYFLLATLTACQGANSNLDNRNGAAWRYGMLSVPGEGPSLPYLSFPMHAADAFTVGPDVRLPVVIYLHGHSGPEVAGSVYAEYLTALEYAVVRLDSTKNPDWVKKKKFIHGAEWRSYSARRRAEISFALDRLREITWVDKERLVLMGQGQGGSVVSGWSQRGFAGIIIVGANCGAKTEPGSPRVPRDIPVLAIKGELDNYFPGNVGCKVSGHGPGSKSIVIPDAPHNIPTYAETQEAIKLFLETCCTSGSERSAS